MIRFNDASRHPEAAAAVGLMHGRESTALIICPRQPDGYQRLRLRIRRWTTAGGRTSPWADLVCLLPDLIHLTVCLLRDARVRRAERALLGAALAYVVLPFDLIPEALVGVPGVLDDLALLAAAYRGVLTRVPADVIEGYWAGPVPLLEVVNRVAREAEARLGRRRWRWLKRVADAKAAPAETPA